MPFRIRALDVFPVSATLDRPVGDGQGLVSSWRATFVRVTAEDGTYGWGQGGGPLSEPVRGGIAAGLAGMDVRDTDAVHDRMLKLRVPRGTLGGLDTAVWDLKGKLLGMPVHQLLGGARRDRVPVYASLHNYSAAADCTDELVERVREAKARGFRGLKMKVGGRSLEEDLGYVRAAREAGGDGFDLMADANQTYEMADAVHIGRALEELGFAWFEEPLRRADLAGYGELRARLDIPIAGGEGATGPGDLVEILRHRAVDITQPDVVGVGGITEARFLPKLAALWGAAPTWHVWNSPLVLVATLHVLANQGPWRALSMAPGAAPLEVTTMPHPMRERVLIGGPSVDADGMVAVPTAPGLGVDVDLEVLKEFALDA